MLKYIQLKTLNDKIIFKRTQFKNNYLKYVPVTLALYVFSKLKHMYYKQIPQAMHSRRKNFQSVLNMFQFIKT